MTEQVYVIDAETKAEIKVLMQAQQENQRIFSKMGESYERMADRMSEMAITVAEQAKDTQHTNQRLVNLEQSIHGESGLEKRMQNAELDQSSDKTKWRFVAGGVGAFITVAIAIVGLLAALVQPVIEILTNIYSAMGGPTP